MGLAGQTGNLFSVASSNGARFFEITSAGIASSTYFIAVNASTSRLDVSGSSTLKDFTFTSASSTGNITIGGSFQANAGQSTFSNVSSTNLDIATRFNFAAGSSTGNLTIGGTFQSNAGQTTLASVSSTNLFGSGYLNFVSGRADLQAVSSTNFSASGYGLFPTLLAQNAVGLGSLSTSTSLVFIRGTETASTSLAIQGVTSQNAPLLTISSSTGIPLFNINALGQVGIATSTYPASSTLLTLASSSQIFNISSGGNVMIGTSTSPNAALLTIATTTNILTVLSNGNVGIGTTGPSGKLHIKSGSAGSISIQTAEDDLIVENSDHAGITIASPDSKQGGILFLSPTTGALGAIIYDHSAISMQFNVNNAPAMFINTAGNVGIGTTGPAPTNGGLHIKGGNPDIMLESTAPRKFEIENTGDFTIWDRTSGTLVMRIRGVTGTAGNVEFGAGNVGIGTTDPSAQKLVVAGNVRVGTGTTGCVEDADGTLLAGTCSSDERLKKNITPFSSVLGRLVQLTPVTYNWRADEFPDRHLGTSLQIGLIAQEVEAQFPELVTIDDNGFKQIVFQYLPFYMLQAIKELDAKNASLSIRVEDLERILASPSSTPVANNQLSGIETIVTVVIAQLQNAYDIVFDKGLLKVAKVITDNITANLGSFKKVELQDEDTGEPYCLTIKSGQLASVKGNCAPEITPTEEANSTTVTATSTADSTTTPDQ